MLHECFCILRPSHQCKNAFFSGAFSFLGAARSRMGPSLNRELKNHRNSVPCPKWQSYNQQNRGVFSSGCQVFELYSQNLGHNLCSYPLHTKIIFKMEFTASLLLSAGGQFLSHLTDILSLSRFAVHQQLHHYELLMTTHRVALSTDVWPSLMQVYPIFICFMPISLLPRGVWMLRITSYWVSPNFVQNFAQSLCTIHCNFWPLVIAWKPDDSTAQQQTEVMPMPPAG